MIINQHSQPALTGAGYAIIVIEKLPIRKRGRLFLTGENERSIYMKREDAREYLKDYLKDYVEQVTSRSKGANMYVCPLCGSGSGPNGTGAFSVYNHGESWKCFSCEKGGDLYDLIGAVEDISDYNDQLKRAADLFGVTIDAAYHKTTAQEDFAEVAAAYQKQGKTEQHTHTHNSIHTSVYTQDYTDFFIQANKDIERTSYHRGLTLETLNRYRIGYVESWTHPKAPNAPPSPRLIIPTSKESYLARDTREQIPETQKSYVKSKVGSIHIFNAAALQTAMQPIFIVEGELDALSIIDVGGEAIGLGSTTKVKSLLELLKNKRPSQPLIIALDNDNAGERACKELSEGLNELDISFCRLNPSGEYKDANEALQRNRAALEQSVKEAIEQAKNIESTEKEQLKKEAVSHFLQDFINNIEESKRAAYLPTGFNSLDQILDGGLYAGLYVVGSISSLGKTTFCLQLADQIAQQGQDVLIFSLEMARNELIAKSVSRLTLIKALNDNISTANAKTTRGILTGTRYKNYSSVEKSLIRESVEEYGKYGDNIYITEGIGNVGIEEIREKVKKHIKITGKAPVVVIDYLQILAPSDIRATDKQNTDKAVLELKRLSRDCSIPVIGISSFNRDNYTAPVNLASFKESGAIEYSSDILIGLQYEGMDYKEGETDGARQKRIRELVRTAEQQGRSGKAQSIQVKVLKNRNGSKGDTTLDFYPMFNYFTDKQEGAKDNDGSGNYKKAESNYNK